VVAFPLQGVAVPHKVIGQIEQVVCAGAKRFFGTQHSTFSSHIARLRGYIGAPDTKMHYHTQRSTGDASIDEQNAPEITGQNYMVEDPSMWEDTQTPGKDADIL